MHVHTLLSMSANEVNARFDSAAKSAESPISARKLTYETERKRPKFFLSGAALTLPTAAEVAVNEHPGGADVVLRLMWGPLPAPFPRALAGAGILIGLLIAWYSDGSPATLAGASLVALLPLAALLYQRRGERDIQAKLGELLGGASFQPKPH